MDSKKLADIAAEACEEKKAQNISLIRIEDVSYLSDWILITNGLSDVQVRSITNFVEFRIQELAHIIPLRKEGVNEAKWALLDYGNLIVNVFQPEERNYYDLESFWSNGEKLFPRNK
tara:strand:- start:1348 stop:1698 length:351 start_codon:yes stop_codon:yes gene_type:complete